MSERICGRCGSTDIEENSLRGEVIWCNCKRCKYFAKVADFPEQTVFDKITASPEVLAEKLVYRELITEEDDGYVYRWRSTILPNDFWYNDARAIAATVARLKEVEK